MHSNASLFLTQLRAAENPEKARWLENYVKHDIRSLGVGVPEIRKLVMALAKEKKLPQSDLSNQRQWLDDLMREEYTEAKLAAILYAQLYWTEKEADLVLALAANWFDRHWVSDWNVCDWLCVRLLTPLVDQEPAPCIAAWRDWNQSPYLWKARASLVPFAQCKTLADHTEVVLDLSRTLIQREERFSKTAVGWVLREYSRIDPAIVTDFLNEQAAYTTREVEKNATKYIA